MALRRLYILVAITLFASLGAQYRTTNFVVTAPTPQIAQQVGQAAEHFRKEKAILWLGQEMPAWPEPCPLTVKVTMSGAGGATSFAFDQGRVLGQHMTIEGSLDRLLASVLPHEVTHTVFAHHFRRPVPRWADEGGAVLSEDDVERNRHDMLCRQILNTPGRAIPLRRLFAMKEYPPDVMALYAQGFSVANFLVGNSNRQAFLNFVAHGLQYGWDNACQVHYRHSTVEELEQAWLTHLRNTRRPPAQLARNTNPSAPESEPVPNVVLRQTVPPAQPFEPVSAPVFRAANPDPEPNTMPALSVPTRPTYLPPTPGATLGQPASAGWSPIPPAATQPPAVRLGAPQFGTPDR